MIFKKTNKSKYSSSGVSGTQIATVIAYLVLIFVTYDVIKSNPIVIILSDFFVSSFSNLFPYRLHLYNQTGFDIIDTGLEVQYYGGEPYSTDNPIYYREPYHLPRIPKEGTIVFPVPNPKPTGSEDIIELIYISGGCTNRFRIPPPERGIKMDYYFELQQMPECLSPKKQPAIRTDIHPWERF